MIASRQADIACALDLRSYARPANQLSASYWGDFWPGALGMALKRGRYRRRPLGNARRKGPAAKGLRGAVRVWVVGLKGVEPLRPLERQNLNLVRLPIPPQPHFPDFTIHLACDLPR